MFASNPQTPSSSNAEKQSSEDKLSDAATLNDEGDIGGKTSVNHQTIEEESNFDSDESDEYTVEINKRLYRFHPETRRWILYDLPEVELTSSSSIRHSFEEQTNTNESKNFQLGVISWNVDFSQPFQKERLIAVVDYLQTLIEPLSGANSPTASGIPVVILLQEVHRDYFHHILRHPFIRANYDVTDKNAYGWDMHYGLVTLMPRGFTGLRVLEVSQTKFEDSMMGREAIYVDVSVPCPDAQEWTEYQPRTRTIRIANTHLESLSGYGDIARPKQLAVVSSRLFSQEVYAGIVGGDMNPIGPDDDASSRNVGLLDAWEAFCGSNASEMKDEERHHTWGYQPPHAIYPPRRMDKFLFTDYENKKDGNEQDNGPEDGDGYGLGHDHQQKLERKENIFKRLRINSIERIGVGLTVAPRATRRDVWVSDHYGLLMKVEIL